MGRWVDFIMGRYMFLLLFLCSGFGQTFTTIHGEIHNIPSTDFIDLRTCPDYVDSCVYVCNDGTSNPCHPNNLYTIAIDTSDSEESTDG